MKKISLMLIALMICMTFTPTIAQIPAPNDTTTLNGGDSTLSIDGYVTTKIAGVGSDVEIMALTRGHTNSTIVTADIIRYPDIDPLDLMFNSALPSSGVVIDTVVMTQSGTHENDSNTMTWEGIYSIPSNSRGGVFGARVIAEDGNLVATDDPTQLSELFRSEFEKVLQAIDDAWSSANPCLEIKGEFDSLENIIQSNGNWSTFVTIATEGQGIGGSQQLWDAMIDAGHNQYNLSTASEFLTALMEFLDSDDVGAGMSFITGLLLYAGEFPIPRTFNDFNETFEYVKTFDAIENYTKFEGTGDFETAYNALVGSNEWVELKQAMDDLQNSTKEAEAIQTIIHNVALLTVSGHPDAIIDALEGWISPLIEGDMDNMTPIQILLVRWYEMAEKLGETDVIDTDGDEIPDQIIWEYEYLLETSEGQAWTAHMESSSASSYVNDAFDNFNTLPEDVINDVIDSFEDPVWNSTGEVLSEFTQWITNASFGERHIEWHQDDDHHDDEPGLHDHGDGDSHHDHDDDDGHTHDDDDRHHNHTVEFEELYDIRTTLYNSHVLDIEIELEYWGPEHDSDYPSQYSMSMTNNHGVTINTILEQVDGSDGNYNGRLTAESIEEAVWSFSQPMANYSGDVSEIEGAELRLSNLRPSILELMQYENVDETFIVSALGVVVEQDETTLVSEPYSLSATSYNYSGPLENAEVDIAIFRISPQLAEETIGLLSPDGDVKINSTSGTLTGQYTEPDLSGDVSVVISPYSGHEDEEGGEYPQASSLDYDIEISGSGDSWDASTETSGLSGLVDITTSGTTVDGLEFDIWEQIPLAGTSGCSRTEGHGGGHHVNIGWNYESFRNDDGEFDKPAFSDVEIDWGDFNITSRHDVDGWESHQYYEHDAVQEHTINIHYTDVDGNTVTHSTNFTEDQGFWRDGDDGEGWFEGYFEKGECELMQGVSVMPNALIIDSIFIDGPMEVLDEQILTTNQSGGVNMIVTPNLPGIYLSMAQTKTIDENGDIYTGMGMNFALVTEASIALGGLTEETTLAGIPIYSAQTSSSGLTTISVTPNGINETNYNASIYIAPVELGAAFQDIGDEEGSEAQEYELEFQQGDTTRSQEVKIETPISLIVASVFGDDELFPTAFSVGLILDNPGELNMTGGLGPGQVTNIGLKNETASRILAMAAPRNGFDPATLDMSLITELFYKEVVREELGWIPVEQDLEKICEKARIDRRDHSDFGQAMNFRISLKQEMKYEVVEDLSPWPNYNATNATLSEEEGGVITPISEWRYADVESLGHTYYADYYLEEGKKYILNSTTTYNGIYEFEVEYDEEDEHLSVDEEYFERCSGESGEMSEDEEYALIDQFFGNFSTMAWGQGSSADLILPILSSPNDDYTVLAIAQVGNGENAELITAWGSEVSIPIPEPPRMENLTLSFSPTNPIPGDMVQVTATNESNQPVEGLSFTVVRNNQTLVALVSNDYGQVEFAIPEGTIIVRVSGGNYYPAELTIDVNDSGSTIDDNGTNLPSDTDGDGVVDNDDLCPNTNGNQAVNLNGCAAYQLDSDGDGVMDDVDMCPTTPVSDVDYIDDNGCYEITEPPLEPNPSVDNGGDGGDSDDTGSASSDNEQAGNSNTMIMMIIGGIILASIGVATLVLFSRRKGDDWNTDEDVIFDSPERPPPNISGEMMDGYEVIEYPQGTGAWWWRDYETGHWMEWK